MLAHNAIGRYTLKYCGKSSVREKKTRSCQNVLKCLARIFHYLKELGGVAFPFATQAQNQTAR